MYLGRQEVIMEANGDGFHAMGSELSEQRRPTSSLRSRKYFSIMSFLVVILY